MALVIFTCPPFVFNCQGGDIIFLFTIWTLLQCWKPSTRRSTVRHWASPLHYYCKVTHRGKERRSKEAHAINCTSHRPDKLPSLPPATMLPLNSKRRVGMTNSSLYPPKINHSTKLEWDTDFSRMKSWVGGWNTGNILKRSQAAWAGDCWTSFPEQILHIKADLSEAAGVTCGIWWHLWDFIRCIVLFNRSFINSFTRASVLHRPSQIVHV